MEEPNKSLALRRNEAQSLLKKCFKNQFFSLVPFDIWMDVITHADLKTITIICQVCLGFKELVDFTFEKNFHDLARRFRKEGQIPLALKYLQKSAEGGNSWSMFHIGFARSTSGGWGLKRDEYLRGAEWFKKAADCGNPAGLALYACCLKYGRVVEKCVEQSMALGLQALSSNNSFAIGFCYHFGLGTQVDNIKAFSYFEKSAQECDEFGQFYLAEFYGVGPQSIDLEKAEYWCLKSSEQGLACSQFMLACLLHESKREHDAIIWFKKCANQEFQDGKNALKEIEELRKIE